MHIDYNFKIKMEKQIDVTFAAETAGVTYTQSDTHLRSKVMSLERRVEVLEKQLEVY